jgi:hypothetical protein
MTYIIEVSEDLDIGFGQADPADYEIVSTQQLLNGKERVTYRYLVAIDSSVPRFFRISW